MKKVLLFIIAIAILAGGCKKKKDELSTALNYTDSNPIVVVFQAQFTQFDHKIQVTSDYDITYTAINEPGNEVITVSSDGKIHGKKAGTAKVKISNGHESMTVNVRVALFKEPTFDFGCGPNKIRKLYGYPTNSNYIQDTIMYYKYANMTPLGYYSAACFEMYFFFDDNQYFESDLYIRNDYEVPQLNNYLDENFDYYTTIPNYIYDTFHTPHDSVPAYIYKYKNDETIICGTVKHANSFDDICLFYKRIEADDEKDLANSLKMRPRSSKFLY